MESIVNFFAPKSRSDFVVKWVFLYLFINFVNAVIEGGIVGFDVFDLRQQLVVIALVGGPFIALALAMLGHQRRLQDRLVSLAATDVLTGLRNRRAFLADAATAHANGDGGALLLIDADHFKRINDTYGHTVGDLCLREIATHLRDAVRPEDVVGRLGGEEFAIYLRNSSAERARMVGERICRGVHLSDIAPREPLLLTLSAGAVLARSGSSIDHALRVADRALYLAKEGGRARIVFAPQQAGPG